jgi:hypothetical protein
MATPAGVSTMDEMDKRSTIPSARRSDLFSWSFYVFGMIVTSAIFTLVLQFVVTPAWGERLFRGWIDPSLRLVVMPLVGLLLGLPVMAMINVLYAVLRRRAR